MKVRLKRGDIDIAVIYGVKELIYGVGRNFICIVNDTHLKETDNKLTYKDITEIEVIREEK